MSNNESRIYVTYGCASPRNFARTLVKGKSTCKPVGWMVLTWFNFWCSVATLEGQDRRSNHAARGSVGRGRFDQPIIAVLREHSDPLTQHDFLMTFWWILSWLQQKLEPDLPHIADVFSWSSQAQAPGVFIKRSRLKAKPPCSRLSSCVTSTFGCQQWMSQLPKASMHSPGRFSQGS